MIVTFPVPLIGFCAYSGSGKTTLLKRLIPLLKAEGLRLAVLKHAHHSFDPDTPGKDSYELRRAGAERVLVASRHRMALIEERPAALPEPSLPEALGHLQPRDLDLVLVEGFKHERYPKIELHRPSLGCPLIHRRDPDVIAVAADAPVQTARPLPLLELNDPPQIRDFLLRYLRLRNQLPAAG